MKRALVTLFAVVVLAPAAMAADFPGARIGGVGGSGTTNASDLASGVVAKARGGWGEDVSGSTGVPYFATAGVPAWDNLAAFIARFGVTLGADNSWTFVVPPTAPGWNSNALDNAHKGNAANTVCNSLTVNGDYCYDLTKHTWVVFDNSAGLADNVATPIYQYLSRTIDAPALTDNIILMGPLDLPITVDNIVLFALDNTGVRTGAATDNATVNFGFCDNSLATYAQCTKAYASDYVVKGDAEYGQALNNSVVAQNGYVKFFVSATNLSTKKLYYRIKYRWNY